MRACTVSLALFSYYTQWCLETFKCLFLACGHRPLQWAPPLLRHCHSRPRFLPWWSPFWEVDALRSPVVVERLQKRSLWKYRKLSWKSTLSMRMRSRLARPSSHPDSEVESFSCQLQVDVESEEALDKCKHRPHSRPRTERRPRPDGVAAAEVLWVLWALYY